MKTFVKKAVLAAILVLLTLSFVTCEDLAAGIGLTQQKEEIEYVDWEYEDMPDGTSQLTVYLDGTLVPATEKTGTPKQSRALNLQLAKMSHDYFEAVFTYGTPGASGSTVARASWELGQSAGIAGVYRSVPAGSATGVTGIDYRPVATSAANANGLGAAVIFVGRKQTMTLLGVGVLTQINKREINGGTVSQFLTTSDRSVTFTVSALTAKLEVASSGIIAGAGSSFLTAAGDTAFTSISAATTPARLTPLGGTEYPLFVLPDYDNGGTAVANTGLVGGDGVTVIIPANIPNYKLIPATYTVGGLSSLGAIAGNGATDLTPAIRLVDRPEVIKREPRYISGGQVWYAIAEIDFGATVVDIPGGTGGYGNGSTTGVPGAPLIETLPINFYLTPPSNGIFSIVFSIPVYALAGTLGVPADSTNGGPPGEIWHITPGYGQNLYNLDNGTDAGGCVLLGINVTALDWLQIFTTGIGFKH